MLRIAKELSKAEVQILQHSLGLTKKDSYGNAKEYRNNFCTGPESTDFKYCRGLTEAGLMRDDGPRQGYNGMHIFFVTEAGKKTAWDHMVVPMKLTKSQRRYRDWLNEDSGQTFAEWLGIGK